MAGREGEWAEGHWCCLIDIPAGFLLPNVRYVPPGLGKHARRRSTTSTGESVSGSGSEGEGEGQGKEEAGSVTDDSGSGSSSSDERGMKKSKWAPQPLHTPNTL